MNNIQKNFKSKAKCGIRAFSGGGLLDDFNARMKGLAESAAAGGGFNTLPDTPSVASAMAEGQRNFDAGMGEGYEQGEQEPSPSNRVRTPGRTSIMTVSPRGLPAFQTGTSLKQFGQQAFADGGTVDPVEQLLSQMKNKYGVSNAPTAPAPAPAPAPTPAPAPVQAAQPAPTIQGAVQALRQHRESLRGFAHGGEVQPFVDGAGYIHGAPGVDKVPAVVEGTGEPIRVGSGERIVNAHQNKALEQLSQEAAGQPLDQYLEDATGKPVGPKVKQGLRAAAGGGEFDDLTSRRPVAPQAPVAGANSSPEAAALRERLASPEGNVIRNQMANAKNISTMPPAPASPAPAVAPTVSAQPAAAPAKPMMEPLEVPTGQAAAAEKPGLVQQAKNAASAGMDKVKSTLGSMKGAPAPSGPEQMGRIVGQQTRAVMDAPKVFAKGNGAGRIAALDFGLRSGNHWDATGGWDDTEQGGIGPMDKGQIVVRDAIGTVGDVVGGAAGIGLGGLARVVGPVSGVAGKTLGGLAGAIAGGNLTEKGMGYGRRLLNAANSALGGDPEYWKDSDALIDKQNAFLKEQPGYEESSVQKGAKKATDVIDKTVGAALEKIGVIDRKGGAQQPSAEEKRIRAANAEVMGGKQQAVDQAATDALKAKNTANNPNVRSLRQAGVQGDVGGDTFEWQKDALGRSSPTTAKTGIRSIDTPNGKVFAGRDAKGQLNVVSNLGQTGEESEAARAKEATRINADLKRQTEAFDKMAIERDMKSNNPADRASAQQRMGLRTLEAETARANQANETTRRGQDMVLQGHQIDNQTKRLTLQNQMAKDNLERNMKLVDDLYGKDDMKNDPEGSTKRRAFIDRLSKTLGQHGRTIGHLSPKDMVEFQTAYDMDKDGKNGSFMQFYNNWVRGTPEVEDFDPIRSTARAAGERGKSNDWGFYETRNGSLRREGSTVGKEFLPGTYDINRKQLLDR